MPPPPQGRAAGPTAAYGPPSGPAAGPSGQARSGRRRRRGGHTRARAYRPATVLLAVILILAGGLVNRSQPGSDRLQFSDRQIAMGRTFRTGGVDVTFTHVAFARIVAPADADPSDTAGGLPDGARRTAGVFLVVEYQLTTVQTVPQGTPTASSISLTASDGTTYAASDITGSSDSLLAPDPGYTGTRSAVFEVNPTRIGDLTLVLTATQLLSTLSTRYQVDLGTGDQKTAGRSAAAAGKLFTLPSTDDRVAS